MKNKNGLALPALSHVEESDPATAGESNGFTLIEILVVIALLGVLGVILTNILSQVLRGQNKINTINLVKQNGQVILDQLSNEIRSAEKIVCIGKSSALPEDTIVLFKAGNYTRFRFVQPVSNSISGNIEKKVFTINDITEATTDDQLCGTANLSGENIQLSFLTNGISVYYDGAEIPKKIFDRQIKASFPDLVSIRFRAGQDIKSKTAESTVSDEGVLFTTAVSVKGGK